MNRGHCRALVGALLRTGYQVGFLKAWRKRSLLKNKQMESQFIYTGDISSDPGNLAGKAKI